ncbi:mycothiol-dependent nitroreductase Rv2466c family protein [Nonomuraea sp. SBT364]|uniref:mycothiol-dependent nitroreductase Rv2466c family protein n=1 Tax=Nonomuraea sp. SBT364 TaxID=1580530 RepID=UPI000A83F7D9|nr:disulfide bond formation protein DsbA [Nonomuraea sp. SBT364]
MIADFWFDPSCPYTWLTSRWLLEVTRVRPVEARWHVMSLSVLNEGRDGDPEGDPEGYLWVPARLCAAVADRYGSDALGRLYTALWTTGGEDQEWLGDMRTALRAAGLPEELADAALTPESDELVRASHARAMAAIGGESGTPVVAVTGAAAGEPVAFFGPVVSQVPTGEAAGRLWDGVLLVAGTPHFHELKGRPHEEPRLS